MKISESDALLIVDLQNDFCPGGALAVPRGDEIISGINELIPRFKQVAASQDWHPKNHCSFQPQGGPWPPHCIQNTRGAALHSALLQDRIGVRIFKAQQPDQDAYSAFERTSLSEELKIRKIRRIFICGLATDYCVKESALDAVKSGFLAVVLTDLIRAVNVRPGDDRKALNQMKQAGIGLAQSSELQENN